MISAPEKLKTLICCVYPMTRISDRHTNCRHLMVISVLALTLTLLAGAISPAMAIDECGAEGVGPDTITCSAANYGGTTAYPDFPAGITYSNSDGLVLIIDDAAITMNDSGVSIISSAAGTGDISVIGTNIGTITTTANYKYGLEAYITDGSSTATAWMTAGSIETSGRGSVGIYAETDGEGDVLAQMDGGSIRTHGDYGWGILAEGWSNGSTGTVTARLTNGDIETDEGYTHGLFASTLGVGEVLTHMTGGTIITHGVIAHGLYAVNYDFGNATAQMDGGSITTNADESSGLTAEIFEPASTATATARLTNGDILTKGDNIYFNIWDYGPSGLAAETDGLGRTLSEMTGGTVTTEGTQAYGILSLIQNNGNTGTATVQMTAGSVQTMGTNSHGLYARTTGTGLATATASGSGSVTVSGADADGILTQIGQTAATYAVAVTDTATITGGSGNGAAIHTVSLALSSGTIDIGVGTTVDGSASTKAIYDEDGDTVVTTAGTIIGGAILGSGNDVFNLAGGSYTGDIYGEDGDDNFNWSAGDLNSGFYGGNGSDTAIISTGANYEATEVLDGGDNYVSTDGSVDTLTLSGLTVAAISTNVLNWENIIIDGGRVSFTDNMLITGSDPGAGLTLTNDGSLNAGTAFALTGNLTTSAGGTFDATGGGAGIYSISGSVINNGVITTQGGGVGDTVSVAGNYSGTGQLLFDVNFASDSADTLVVNGDVASGITTISVSALDAATTAATGNDILLVDVTGVSPSTYFVLDSGPLWVGGRYYALGQHNLDWILSSYCTSSQAINGTGSAVLGCTTADTLTLTTGAVISGDVEGAGDVDIIQVEGDATVTGIVRGSGNGGDNSAATDAGDLITINTSNSVGGVDGDLGDDQIWVLGGTVTGDVLGNVGNDTITLNGATAQVNGTIDGGTGDDALNLLDGTVNVVSGGDDLDTIALNGATVTTRIDGGAGDDIFTWSSGMTALFNGNDGSDTATVTANEYNGTQTLDGGDDISVGDGYVDVLTLDGITSGTTTPVNGGLIANWEEISLTNGSNVQVINLVGNEVIVADSNLVATNLTATTLNLTNSITTVNGASVVPTINTCGGSTTIGGTSAVTDANGCVSPNIIRVEDDAVVASIYGAGGADTITISRNSSVTLVHGGGDGSDDSTDADMGDIITINTTGTVGSVKGDMGDDQISVLGGTITGSVLGDVGNDTITLNGSAAEVNGTIDGGTGADTIGLLAGWADTVDGDAGNDRITLAGATMTTQISCGKGDDVFTWSSGTTAMFDGDDGSDTATVTAGEYDSTQVLDGGDDVSTADGMIDTLTLNNLTIAVTGANFPNWENIVIDGGLVSSADGALTTGSDSGTGLTITGSARFDAGSTFALTGNMRIDPGSVFDGTGGGTGIYTVSGSVRNHGMITMQDGAVGDSITIEGDYSAASSLMIDVNTATDTADKLTIQGSVTSGTTQVVVNNVTPGDATGSNIPVVIVMGTSSAQDFALAGGALTAGPFDYLLEHQDPGFVLAAPGGGAGGLGIAALDLPPGSNAFVLIPQVNSTGATYEAAPLILSWFNRLPTLEQREGQRLLAGTDEAGNGLQPGPAAWVRLYGDRLDWTTSTGSSIDTDNWGLQAGVDNDVANTDNGRFVLGLTGQYGKLDSTVTSELGFGNIDADGIGIGATATWYRSEDGPYVDLQGQYNWISNDISSSAAGSLAEGDDLSKTQAWALGAELGRRFRLTPNARLVPQAQMSFGSVQGAAFIDNLDNAVDLGNNTFTIGRLGLAYEYEKNGTPGVNRQKLYVIGNILHDFSEDASVDVAGVNLSTSPESTWGEIGLGGSATWDRTKTFYGEVAYRAAFDNASDNHGLALTVGLRIQW